MGWRERLQPASFRGLEFGVEDTAVSSGRRIVEFRFPTDGENDGATEDQGGDPNYHEIRAFVFGDDFDLQALQFEAALRKRGVGDLVLPRRGRMPVQVLRWRRVDTWREGRIARFDFTARESPSTAAPAPVIAPNRAVDSAAAGAAAAAKTGGAAAITSDGAGFVREATLESATTVSLALRAVHFVGGIQSRIAAYVDSVRQFSANLGQLIASPANLAASIVDAAGQIVAAGMIPQDAFAAYKGMFDLPPNLAGGTTDEGVRADTNRQAVIDLLGLAALAGAAQAAAQAQWGSVEEALAARKVLLDQADDLGGRATDDGVFQAIEDLRAAIVRTVPGTSISAPPALKIVLEQTLPALAVAYRWLDDADQADAIAQANGVLNPLFMPGGLELRVVSRAGV